MSVTTKRKKYVREMKPTWWKKLDFYKLYMLRESTAIPAIWFCLVLFYAVICLIQNDVASFISFLQNPLVVILNIIALAGSLFHAATLYSMTPAVLNIIYKNEKLNPNIIRNALWATTAVASIVILALVYI